MVVVAHWCCCACREQHPARSGACLQFQSGDLSQLDMRQLTCCQPLLFYDVSFYQHVSTLPLAGSLGRADTYSRIRIFDPSILIAPIMSILGVWSLNK